MKLLVAVEEACRGPRGYGLAWFDYEIGQRIAAPVPLNLVLRLTRLCWIRLATWYRPSEHDRRMKAVRLATMKAVYGHLEELERRAYQQGVRDGAAAALREQAINGRE